MARPPWRRRAVRNRHRHAIEQASRRWRGGRRDDSGRTRRKILISTQVAGANPAAAVDVLHKIDAAGYDAYLTYGGKNGLGKARCVPALNATGGLAREAFVRENQLAVVKRGFAYPCISV